MGVPLVVLYEKLGSLFEVAGLVTLTSALLIGSLPPRWFQDSVQGVSETVLFGALLLAVVRGG